MKKFRFVLVLVALISALASAACEDEGVDETLENFRPAAAVTTINR